MQPLSNMWQISDGLKSTSCSLSDSLRNETFFQVRRTEKPFQMEIKIQI